MAQLKRGERQAMAMPLEEFAEADRQRILQAVARPKPPPRWLALGPPDSPRPVAWIESRAWFEWHWARGNDPEKSRVALPAWLRAAVIARDGLVCGLCGGEVEPSDVHIDHIQAVSRGGSDDIHNLQVTHSWCNLAKGAR